VADLSELLQEPKRGHFVSGRILGKAKSTKTSGADLSTSTLFIRGAQRGHVASLSVQADAEFTVQRAYEFLPDRG